MVKNTKILFFAVMLLLFQQACKAEYTNEYEIQDLLDNPQQAEITLYEKENNAQVDSSSAAEMQDENLQDNVETEYSIFSDLGKNESDKEQSLIEKIYKTEITRTDIPSFLLKDALTFEYKKGPFKELQFFGGYRGSVGAMFNPHSYSTKYDTLTNEVGVFGKFANPYYEFKISTQPVPSSGQNYIDYFVNDFYIVNTQIPHHKITVGRSRVQTGIEGSSGPYTLPFAARSQIARNFGNARSTSLKLTGNYNYADYSLAYGSSGRRWTSGLPGTEFTGWLNLKPFGDKDGKLGKLTVGGGLNAGHNRINYSVGSVYVGYKHKKLWTNFEAAIADGYSGFNGSTDKKACGWAYTLGWKFTPQLQLIGRVDQFDPDRDVSHNLKREYTVGLNWFIKGQALKVILNWVYCNNQNEKDSQKIILATQIML